MLKWMILPPSLFEWKSYLRKNTIFIILFYPLCLASAYNSSTLIIGGLFILDFVSFVFKYNENKEMLEIYFSQISFKEKIKHNVIFFNIILFSIYLLFIILNINDLYIVFMNLYYLLILTRKYKLYSHDKQITDYYVIACLENTFSAMTIIPAIFLIKNNLKLGNDKINTYVKNKKY